MNCQIFKAALNNIEIFCVENVKNAMCIQCKWLCITKQRKNEINKIIKVHKKPVVKDSKRQREREDTTKEKPQTPYIWSGYPKSETVYRVNVNHNKNHSLLWRGIFFSATCCSWENVRRIT